MALLTTLPNTVAFFFLVESFVGPGVVGWGHTRGSVFDWSGDAV